MNHPVPPSHPPPRSLLPLPESEVFWQSEQESRTRCTSMTQYELLELEALSCLEKDPELKKCVKKLKENWGASSGTARATKRLIEHMMEQKSFAPGDVVDFRTTGFSILKHWMLANNDPWSARLNKADSVRCFCFAYTCLMPNGCVHKPGAKHASKTNDHWCAKCSTCTRCGKYPGLICLLA